MRMKESGGKVRITKDVAMSYFKVLAKNNRKD
jgi:hypothetical protein